MLQSYYPIIYIYILLYLFIYSFIHSFIYLFIYHHHHHQYVSLISEFAEDLPFVPILGPPSPCRRRHGASDNFRGDSCDGSIVAKHRSPAQLCAAWEAGPFPPRGPRGGGENSLEKFSKVGKSDVEPFGVQ